MHTRALSHTHTALRADPNTCALFCPDGKCCGIVLADERDTEKEKRYTCDVCSHDFCCDCHSAWHEGLTCAAYQESIAGNAGVQEDAEKAAKEAKMLNKLVQSENWSKCPCGTIIEKESGCNHITHFRAQGCTYDNGLDRTDYCSMCYMVVGGKHYKTEPDGITLHYPRGLYEPCRTAMLKDPRYREALMENRTEYFVLPQTNTGADGIGVGGGNAGAAAAAAAPDRDRYWRTGLCSFCSHSRVERYGTCLCPCYAGATVENDLTGEDAYAMSCAQWCLCCCVKIPHFRWKVRKMFNIHGNCVQDCLASYCCTCCSILQVARELESRAQHPHVNVMV